MTDPFIFNDSMPRQPVGKQKTRQGRKPQEDLAVGARAPNIPENRAKKDSEHEKNSNDLAPMDSEVEHTENKESSSNADGTTGLAPVEIGMHGRDSDDTSYSEPASKFRRRLALLTNPFYNYLKQNYIAAYVLMTLRSLLLLAAIFGAILQVSEAISGECYVYSAVGGFTNFPKDVSGSVYFGNLFSLNTVVCSSASNFGEALDDSMENDQSFDKCGVAGYDATS